MLQHIGVKTFVDAYAAQNQPENLFKYLDQSFNLIELNRQICHPNSYFYFACCRQVPIGYLKLNIEDAQTEKDMNGGLEIERIYVLHHYQGYGVGRCFIDKTIEIARFFQKEFIWLGVWEKNPNAIEFYQKMGFEEFAKHKFIIGSDVQTDLLMRRYVNL